MTNKKTNNTPKVMTANQVGAFKFSVPDVTLPTELRWGNRLGSDVMLYWGGHANNYPEHLNKLYSTCAIHQGIINVKKDYILGDKIVYKGTDKVADFKVNKDETIDVFLAKIVEDFLIYNVLCVEVIYNSSGEPVEWNHIPAKYIRTNTAKSKFWYSKEWAKGLNNSLEFDTWKSNKESDYNTKIFWHSGYVAGTNEVYHEVDYIAAIKAIETAIAISDFHHNNINTSFSASSIISFHNGEPSDEVKKEIQDSITEGYTGSTGKRMILNFADTDSKPVSVEKITPDSWNEQFLTTKEAVEQDIIVAHKITSGLLIGLKTEGQLGGSTEQDSSFKIFKRTYVDKKRAVILRQINLLFEGVFNPLDILDEAVEEEIDPILEKICTINELRQLKGLPLLPNSKGDRLLTEQPTEEQPQEIAPENIPSQFAKQDEAIEVDEDEIKFNKVAHFGLDKNDFVHLRRHAFASEMQFDADNRLTNYLIEQSPFAGQSLSSIKQALDDSFTIQEIREEIAKLVNTRVINPTELIDSNDLRKAAKDLSNNPTNNNTPNINRIEIRYSYEGPADEKNRAFCHKLVRASKYYTRAEIQQMSEVLGFDIYSHKGGKNCRHRWEAHTLVRK